MASRQLSSGKGLRKSRWQNLKPKQRSALGYLFDFRSPSPTSVNKETCTSDEEILNYLGNCGGLILAAGHTGFGSLGLGYTVYCPFSTECLEYGSHHEDLRHSMLSAPKIMSTKYLAHGDCKLA